MASFGAGSGAGLFGYRPLLLQQCVRAEAYDFTRSLTVTVNHLASGSAPQCLARFLAGGVSIALAKSNGGVRPLCCGDPLRRLVAKCFCLGAKDEISRFFKGKNFGVGCPGGVEVVAHSLRYCVSRLAGRMRPSRSTSGMPSTRSIGPRSWPRSLRFSPGCPRGPRGATVRPLPSSMTTVWMWCLRPVFSRVTPWGLFIFVWPSLAEIQGLDPTYNKWYMDDGHSGFS